MDHKPKSKMQKYKTSIKQEKIQTALGLVMSFYYNTILRSGSENKNLNCKSNSTTSVRSSGAAIAYWETPCVE